MSNDLVKKVTSDAVRNLDLAIEHLGLARGQLKALQHVDLSTCEQLLARSKILRQSLNQSLKSGSPSQTSRGLGR